MTARKTVKKRRTVLVIDPDLTGPQTGAHSGAQSGEESADLLSDLANIEGGVVVVYRMPAAEDREQTPEYVGKWEASTFATLEALQDFLRDQLGGGKFQVRGRNNKGQWIGSARVIRVAKTAAPAAVPGQVQQPQAPQRDYVDVGIKLTAALTPLLTAIITRPAPAPVQGLALADALALMDRNKGPTIQEQIGMLAQVKEAFAGEGGGDAKPAGSPLLGVLDGIIKAIPSVMGGGPAAQAAAAAAARAAQGQPPPQALPPAAQSAPAPQAAPAPNVPQELHYLAAAIVRAAEADSDPGSYAVLIADSIGYDAVAQLLAQPDPVAVLLTMFPAAEPHREWLGELVDQLREWKRQADEPEAAEPVEPAGEGKP
jgi:hypothetical protein